MDNISTPTKRIKAASEPVIPHLELSRPAAFEGKKSNRTLEGVMRGIFFTCGLIAIAFVVSISAFLIISGLPAIRTIGIGRFLFGTRWASTAAEPAYGILPFILTSVYGTLGAILISVPVGLLCAIYLAKFAGSRLAGIIRASVELLAGIPSVVYGLIGMILIVPAVRTIFNLPDGANLFSAILVLSIMVLPNVISVSETALLAVPKEYEEASLALGANYTETVFKVSVPAAKSGIASAVVLGCGPGHRRSDGGHDGLWKCGEHACPVPVCPVPDHGYRQ